MHILTLIKCESQRHFTLWKRGSFVYKGLREIVFTHRDYGKAHRDYGKAHRDYGFAIVSMYVVAKLRLIYSAASQLSCLKKNTPLQASLRVCSSLAKVTS